MKKHAIFNKITILLAFVVVNVVLISNDLMAGSPVSAADQVKTVVIDAGHGGKDTGAPGRLTNEKTVALSVALKLGKMIKKQYPDVKIIYTRDSDVFIPLHERASIANRNEADLFISIHCNSSPRRNQARGSETFVLGVHKNASNLEVAKRENSVILMENDHKQNYEGFDPNSEVSHIMLNMYQNTFLDRSIEFASAVEEISLAGGKRKSRGVKQGGLLVLKNTFMPSVLVELGFINHSEEEKYLMSKAGQKEMVDNLLKAFSRYKTSVEGHTALASAPAKKKVQKVVSKPKRKSTPVVVQAPVKRVSTPKPVKHTAQKPVMKTRVSTDVEFAVQLGVSRHKTDLQQRKWRNIKDLSIRFENGWYKYQVVGLSSYEVASKRKAKMRAQGFKDAFIVAYSNGDPIKVSRAIAMSH